MGGGLPSDSDSGMFVLRLASFHNDLHDDDDDADDDDDDDEDCFKKVYRRMSACLPQGVICSPPENSILLTHCCTPNTETHCTLNHTKYCTLKHTVHLSTLHA